MDAPSRPAVRSRRAPSAIAGVLGATLSFTVLLAPLGQPSSLAAAGDGSLGLVRTVAVSATAADAPPSAGDPVQESPNVTVEHALGEVRTVGAVAVAWQRGDQRSSTFTVAISLDGASWTEVLHGHGSGTTTGLERHALPGAVEAAHVRVVGHGDSLTRLELYGPGGRGESLPTSPAADVMPAGEERFHVTWDDVPLQDVISPQWLRQAFEQSPDVNVAYAEHKNLSNTSVVDKPDGPGRVLRVRVPAGALSHGLLLPVNIKQTQPGYDEAWLQYRVRFGDGFQFVRGGKLPGLSGGPSSGNQNMQLPHGGNRAVDGSNGFSARHMWMNIGVGHPHLRQYVYHPHRSSSAGDEQVMDHHPEAPQELVAGRWYTITQRVVMNTPGRHDGVIEGWIDGFRHYRRADYNFRADRSWGINVLHWHVYFGGSSNAWAHSRDELIYFDDIRVVVPDAPTSG